MEQCQHETPDRYPRPTYVAVEATTEHPVHGGVNLGRGQGEDGSTQESRETA